MKHHIWPLKALKETKKIASGTSYERVPEKDFSIFINQ
jgi:hypothetical protein